MCAVSEMRANQMYQKQVFEKPYHKICMELEGKETSKNYTEEDAEEIKNRLIGKLNGKEGKIEFIQSDSGVNAE